MQQKYLIGSLFDEEELAKKQNASNMKLKDPMGNTRWRGAFTGGFQAGYHNTCGSKQGWVPSTFISTIGNRTQAPKQQSIFDYMDKEDLGREVIGSNVTVHGGYGRILQDADGQQANFMGRIGLVRGVGGVEEGLGERILRGLRRAGVGRSEPADEGELEKLLERYSQEQILYSETTYNPLRGTQGHMSIFSSQPPQDDFIQAYQQLFHKIIRSTPKQETQQQLQKRREQNKIYFDFTRPLDQQPEYLKQIQDIEQAAKPRKRRKNIVNGQALRDLFREGKREKKIGGAIGQEVGDYGVPQGYDVSHRVHKMREKEKQFVVAIEDKKKHKILNLNQRSQILQENKLSSRFVAAGTPVTSNKFMRASQEEASKGLQKVFQDPNKNSRYWDYVLELQGKKISAQLQYLSYQQSQKQKQQFQKQYKLRTLNKSMPPGSGSSSKQVKKGQEKCVNKKEIQVVRKTGTWKPEKLLCKRFGCVLPYKEEYVGRDGQKGRDARESYF